MLERIREALANYTEVLQPDQNVPEWWAGAPSVVQAPGGEFYMSARMREGDSPKGKRGYEVRILRSEDGRDFEPIQSLRREDAKIPGFERAALVYDAAAERYKLWGCTSLEQGWGIIRFDDVKNPEDFDARTARPVLSEKFPEDDTFHVTGYKDPVVHREGNTWHMFVIGSDRVERIHHFVSEDGDHWERGIPAPVIPNTGWHSFYTRPASVLPMEVGYLFVYEGSHFDWYDPNYNIATGLAYTPDLRRFYDLTPDEPLLKSTTPGPCHTWRYSSWLHVDDRVYVYWEAARPNSTNVVRMAELKVEE